MKPVDRLQEARKQLDIAIGKLIAHDDLTEPEERWLNDAGRNMLAVEKIHRDTNKRHREGEND